MAWGNDYLSHAQRTMSHKTYVEKQLVMREFFDFCGKAGIIALEDISPSRAYRFLTRIYVARGGNVANKSQESAGRVDVGLDFVGFPTNNRSVQEDCSICCSA